MSFGFEKVFGSGEKRMQPPSDEARQLAWDELDEQTRGAYDKNGKPLLDTDPLAVSKVDPNMDIQKRNNLN